MILLGMNFHSFYSFFILYCENYILNTCILIRSLLSFGQSQNLEPKTLIIIFFVIFLLSPSSNLASSLLISSIKEALQLACSITKFQKDTGHKKNLCIKPHLQALIDYLFFNFELKYLPPRTSPKRQTRVVKVSISLLYSNFWLTNNDTF